MLRAIFDRFQAPRILKNTAPANDFEDICICFMIALGTDSGPILAPFWNPKSDQIGPKRVPKSINKNDRKTSGVWDRFFNDFCSILAPNLGGPGGPTNQGFRVKSAPGATLGPKWNPSPIQARFLLDLDRFLVDFGVDVGRFLSGC